jgi:class 3 adenylate cyclase
VEYVEGDYVVTSPVVRDPSGTPASLEERCFANCHQVAASLVALAFRLIELGQAQNLKLKAGISTGPSVAGIIGQSRKFYRLFGDTVNTAARMKAYGEAGLVHMTDHTYELIKVILR